MKFISLIVLFSVFASGPGKAPDSNLSGEARIVLNRQENMLQIETYYQNTGSETELLKYKLYTIRQGRSGTSRNAQGGSFEAAAGEQELLAQTLISVNSSDSYKIKLQVFRNNELISQDSVQFNGTKTPAKTY